MAVHAPQGQFCDCPFASVDFKSGSCKFNFDDVEEADDLFILVWNPLEEDNFVILAEPPFDITQHIQPSAPPTPTQHFSKCLGPTQ